MKGEHGLLIGVCRPVPGVLGFVTPIFSDGSGAAFAQIVRDGRVVRFAEVDLGEEFVSLRTSVSASIGDPAIYGMEFEDSITLAPLIGVMPRDASGRVAWSDADAIKAAFEKIRHEKTEGLLTFPRTGSGQHVDLEYQKTRDPVHGRNSFVSEQAEYWFFRCVNDPSPLRSDRREFLAWMRSTPENIAELFKITQLDGKLRRLKWSMDSSGLTKSNVVEHTPYLPQRYQHDPAQRKQKRSLSFNLAAFAVSLFVCVRLGFVALNYMQSEQVVTTGASQWHHMTLPDGTNVHVDARSRIEVAYTGHERIVHVYKGCAVFEIAKDPDRPFIARTHLIDTMAVGTRFEVAIGPGVTTTVSEGSVRVTGRGARDGTAVVLKADEKLRVFDSSLTFPQRAHVDAERKLQWANGLLILSGMTVSEGVEQLNRRNRTQIVVESSALGERIIKFARVDVDDPERYATLVAAESNVTMTWDKKKSVIRLSESLP